MITVRPDSRVYLLLTLLSYVGEFPLSSIHLLGSKEAWRKLIHQLSIQQTFRFPDMSERISCKLLLINGRGRTKSIRLSKSAVSILEQFKPDAAHYYTDYFLRHNHSGDEKRVERLHRVAEAVAFFRQAGYETCPYLLPPLQLFAIRNVVPDAPSFYISNELKHIGDDDVNKISFSRIAGAIFAQGGCYAVYNSRDYLMKWNGRGESKTRLMLTEIARMNAKTEEVTSAILLGKDYDIAVMTLRSLNSIKRAEMRFDSNYDHLHFIPMDSFGMRLVNILTLPDWRENLLSLLFDEDDCANGNSNISLRQEPCTTYTYNADGNATAVNSSGSDSQTVEYVSGTAKPSTVRTTGSGAYYYQYLDTNNKYLPSYISNATTGVYTYYGYDKFGNNTETHIGELNGNTPSSYPKIKSSAVYSEDGSLLVSETNGNGQTTSYVYNKYRDVLQTTDSNGTNVVTQEIATNDRPSISYISGVVSVNYSYSNGLLSRIIRGGYITGNATSQKQYYNMSYDSFGNMTEVSIGENVEDARVLASYNYGGNNNHLDSMTYGNGDSIEYTYDDLDRMTQETWDDGTSYLYMYNAEGALAQKLNATDETKVDNGTADAVNYQYDSLGRLIYSSSAENGETIILTEHLYDRANRIDKQTYQLRNSDGSFATYVSDYSYRASDGSLTYVDSVNGNFGDYGFEYDDIARLSARYNYYFRQDYTYRNISSSQTTTQIANIAYSKRDGGANFNPFSLAYTYDALGNIKTITGTDISGQNASYVYDVQSQLTSAVVDGKNYSYEYDTYGNIRKAVENGTTHTYTYGDADWKDLLTAYDGQTITYDEIGNPTSYYNGTRWDFDWEKGRQLVSAESDNHEIEYTYDMAGIRDSKTVDGVTYNYLTLDGKVVRQTWGNNVLDIIYDNSGLPYALKYNGAYYIYVLNQQGDVIRIVNNTGATVAEYRYDAWGNVIYSSGSMAAINPIRYRGYYYDTETGFYYLQSRYYDPSIGRFINADNYAFVGATSDFAGYNQFAYCGNNPISREDSSGMLWFVSVVVGMGTQYIADVLGNLADKKTGWDVLKPTSSCGEYIAAGVTALIPGKGVVGSFVRNVVAEGIKVAEKLHNGDGIDWCESTLNITLGTVFDTAFEKVADKVGAYISSKMPRNYSSYAGDFYVNKPNATREQVLSSMQRAIRTNRYIADIVSTGIDVVRSCLPY